MKATLKIFVVHPERPGAPPRPLGTEYDVSGRRFVDRQAVAKRVLNNLGKAVRTLSATSNGFVAYVYPTAKAPGQTGALPGWVHKPAPSQ